MKKILIKFISLVIVLQVIVFNSLSTNAQTLNEIPEGTYRSDEKIVFDGKNVNATFIFVVANGHITGLIYFKDKDGKLVLARPYDLKSLELNGKKFTYDNIRSALIINDNFNTPTPISGEALFVSNGKSSNKFSGYYSNSIMDDTCGSGIVNISSDGSVIALISGIEFLVTAYGILSERGEFKRLFPNKKNKVLRNKVLLNLLIDKVKIKILPPRQIFAPSSVTILKGESACPELSSFR